MDIIRKKKLWRYLALIIFILSVAAFIAAENSEAVAASNTLYWGSKGQAVKDVQQKLKNWGYYKGAVDGVIGAKTYSAIINFQKKNGLKADGIVGQATYKALGLNKYVNYSSGGSSSSSGSSGGNSGGSSVSTSDETMLLAKAIFAEAEGEPYTGKVAVGAVLLNRVSSPDFPNSLSGVIYQSNALESVSNGRFSASANNAECIKAAKDALNGWDPTYGCLYFWNPATATSSWIWTRQIVVQYGKHVFGK